MSSARVKKAKTYYEISSYSFDSANNIVTANSVNHGLYSGIPCYLISDKDREFYKGTANVVSANVFTFAINYRPQNLTHVAIDGYTSIGNKPEVTLPRGTGTETIVQSYVNGTGGAAYNIDVSLDIIHWIPAANVSHTTSDGDTGFVTISPGWSYMRANVTSIGANTNLVIMTGE